MQADVLTVQATPKRLKLPADSTVLALSSDVKGIFGILSNQGTHYMYMYMYTLILLPLFHHYHVHVGTLTCCNFSLETAKLSLSSTFPEPSSKFLSSQLLPRPQTHPPPMKLIPLGLSLWLLVDSSGGLYPLAKDSMGGMKQLPLLVCVEEREGGRGRERERGGRERGRGGRENGI